MVKSNYETAKEETIQNVCHFRRDSLKKTKTNEKNVLPTKQREDNT